MISVSPIDNRLAHEPFSGFMLNATFSFEFYSFLFEQTLYL